MTIFSSRTERFSAGRLGAAALALLAPIAVLSLAGCSGSSNGNSSSVVNSSSLPAISNVSPAIGVIAGGTTVTITGTDFSNVSAVRFGSVNATSFTVVSATEITAISPAETAGTGDITVVTANGTSTTNSADHFTYGAVPAVTFITDNTNDTTTNDSGTANGAVGDNLTITGTGFTNASAVRFGSVNATSFTVVSATEITAVVPAGTGTDDVTVVTANGTSSTTSSDQFHYAPIVTNVTDTSDSTNAPADGNAGDTVTITGTGFLPGSTVSFGSGNSATVTNVTATTITVTVPSIMEQSIVDVRVTDSNGTSAPNPSDLFAYAP
jgi:hypothetical protein